MRDVISHLPYSTPAEPWLLEVKALVLISVFVYAFFKFTWSAWQYNVLSIIVGASPTAAESEPTELAHYVENAANIAGLAGDSYNKGIRAYYFAFAVLAWFVDALMFLSVTLVVTLVLYRREFFSPDAGEPEARRSRAELIKTTPRSWCSRRSFMQGRLLRAGKVRSNGLRLSRLSCAER